VIAVVTDYQLPDTTPPRFVGKPHATPKRPTLNQRTSLKFRLTEPAKVAFSIVGCRKHKCRHLTTFRIHYKAGLSEYVFLDHVFLPGPHHITLTATDAAGNKSKPARVNLVVRR
jgi:hypothetical protein